MPTELFGYDVFNAARAGDESGLFRMLDDGRLSDFERCGAYHDALDGAARGGHRGIVERLLQYPGIDYRGYRDQAITGAVIEGHADILNLFLADPRLTEDSVNHALPWACRYGHESIVRRLLSDPRIDSAKYDGQALRWDRDTGNTTIVDILSQISVPPKNVCKTCGKCN